MNHWWVAPVWSSRWRLRSAVLWGHTQHFPGNHPQILLRWPHFSIRWRHSRFRAVQNSQDGNQANTRRLHRPRSDAGHACVSPNSGLDGLPCSLKRNQGNHSDKLTPSGRRWLIHGCSVQQKPYTMIPWGVKHCNPLIETSATLLYGIIKIHHCN